MRLCRDINTCLMELETNNKLAVAVSRVHAMNNPFILNSKIYCFSKHQHIYTYPLSIIAQRNFHLIPYINDILQKLVEFGLVEHWVQKYRSTIIGSYYGHAEHFEYDNDNNNEDDDKENEIDNVIVTLSVEHMKGAFYILICGYTLACIIFIMECLTYSHVNIKYSNRIWQFIDKRLTF